MIINPNVKQEYISVNLCFKISKKIQQPTERIKIELFQ